LNFKFDFVVNDRKTIIYRTDVANAEISAGSKNIAINPSIDYVLNKQFNVRVFYTNNVTKPYTSQTFDTAFSTFGFAIKFNLQ
jgi:cell surface protein SprA